MVEEIKVKDLREKKPQKEKIPSLKEGIYLFVSYDLVNSTRLKTLCLSREWQELIEKYYKKTEDLASNPLDSSIWKYIGDEVIIYKYISDPGTLCETICNASTALRELNLFIRSWESGSTIRRNLLAAKCTVWCALIDNGSQEANKCMLLRVNTLNTRKRRSEQYIPDFIGPDIDIGFRIAKYADRARMLLSSDLALLVQKCSEITHNQQEKAYFSSIADKMKIVAFKQLKGVWHDRLYPIIWYEDSWNDLCDSFEYDEHHSSDIVKELLNTRGASSKDISTLIKVYEDIGVPDKVNSMTEIFQKNSQQKIITRQKPDK